MSSEIDDEPLLTLAEANRRIQAGDLDPRDLTAKFLARAVSHTGDASCDKPRAVYAGVSADRAWAEAEAAFGRQRRGQRRGPLDGAPISWKDNVDIAGRQTGAGAPRLAGWIAKEDAEIVKRLDRQGAVVLGETHMSELAFSGLGYNGQTATPPNRYDPNAVPGGSSAGAAASVAQGLCLAAIGTDTGGSVRIPAAWNGLVGLKPTHGLLPMQGVAPLSPSLDVPGPITHTVEDAALLFGALNGAAAPDLAGSDIAGRRFLCAEGLALEGMTKEGRVGYDRTLQKLREAGAKIDAIEPPEFPQALDLMARQGAIVNTEGWAVWGEAISAAPEAISPMIRSRFESGASFRADQSDGARLALKRLSASFLTRIAGAEALLLPTVANKAPPIALIAEGGDEAMAENLMALRNTRLANVFGLCALCLPAGLDSSGAPVSLMLFARPFEEARLLRLGAAIEAALA